MIKSVAYFLRFYHGYTLRQVMQEPATWFFALLNQAFKIESEERLKELGISAYPHMKQQEAAQIRRSYEDGTRDILETLEDYEDYSGINRLKKEM